MGVYMDLYVSPEAGFVVSREKFVSLAADLISNDFVTTHCAICEGKFEEDLPLGMVDDFYANRFTNKNILQRRGPSRNTRKVKNISF